MEKNILVTGGAGFIGSHLVEKLIKNEKNNVIILDNLSSGRREFLPEDTTRYNFFDVDLFKDNIEKYFVGIDEVWHLATKPTTTVDPNNIRLDINNGILASFNVMEAMRKNDVKKILFTSTSAAYGEIKKFPTPEDYAPLFPYSLYAASKLSVEALLSAFSNTFSIKSVIFRLANIIGPRLKRGVTYDFFNKLKKNPNELEILGDGKQKKSFMYVDDCVSAMMHVAEINKSPVDVFNIGSDDWIEINDIAKIICEKLGLNPKFKYTGGKYGWPGDVPLMLLDISKLKSTGWKSMHNSKSAVELTVEHLKSTEWH